MITDERLKEVVGIIRADVFTYPVTYEEKVVATLRLLLNEAKTKALDDIEAVVLKGAKS